MRIFKQIGKQMSSLFYADWNGTIICADLGTSGQIAPGGSKGCSGSLGVRLGSLAGTQLLPQGADREYPPEADLSLAKCKLETLVLTARGRHTTHGRGRIGPDGSVECRESVARRVENRSGTRARHFLQWGVLRPRRCLRPDDFASRLARRRRGRPAAARPSRHTATASARPT